MSGTNFTLTTALSLFLLGSSASLSGAASLPAPCTGASANLALKILTQLAQDKSKKAPNAKDSLLVSPEGVRSVLSGLALGASKDSKALIKSLYNGKDIRSCAWNSPSPKKAMKGKDKAFRALNLDLLLLGGGISLQPPIVKALSDKKSKTKIVSIPQKEFAAWQSKLNKSIADEYTDGLIKDALDLDPATAFAWSNILYFKAPWRMPFDPKKTKKAAFYPSADHSKAKQVPMMSMEQSVLFDEDQTFTRILLPYEDGDHYMQLFLPKSGYAPSKWIGKIKAQDLQVGLKKVGEHSILNWKGKAERIKLSLPRFDLFADLDLAKLLKSAGFGGLFGSPGAFPDLIKPAQPLTALTQKLRVITDETGSKAAAVTTALMERSHGKSREIHFNRPFFFAISQASTGAQLFTGVVSKP
ncbi:MAG: serpin family protein [Cohaesibacter sp.]|nr:serpin family protein [Cohaesibacter sp.]